MKPVHELTNDELRAEIADRIGYFVATVDPSVSESGEEEYALVRQSGDEIDEWGVRHEGYFFDRIYRGIIRNWPYNLDEALTLADRCIPENCALRIEKYLGVFTVQYYDCGHQATSECLPRALSELVLLALRAAGGSGEDV